MKHLIFPILISTNMIFSEKGKTDEAEVEKQIDALIASWNNHNYDDISNYATEDCDWVNVVGMWWKNRNEVQYAHQVFHNGMFKNVKLTKKSIHFRSIAKDVMVVHLLQRVGAYTTPSGSIYPEADNMKLMVFVKKEGNWLLTAVENVVVVEQAQMSNPINNMPKRN
ncbi:SgcJ/EcaC family oxidoreductase [Lacihabitans lacunae]|uniref:SgcJ/EcaC family oxidoreductase n=1 Tax=Lacihabitans lacunae TaxID=1028214 RepID=A0ABV7YZ28_9BACT